MSNIFKFYVNEKNKLSKLYLFIEINIMILTINYQM